MLDELTRRLNALGRASSLEHARATGLLLVEVLYGGDLAVWLARGSKEVGYRRLVARGNGGGLSVPASVLSRALALVSVEARLGVASWQSLSFSHIRLVFGLSEAQQDRLLRTGEAERWSLRRMEEEASACRKERATRRGRPRDPPFARTTRRLRAMLRDRERSFGGTQAVTRMSDVERAECEATWAAMELECARMRTALSARLQVEPAE